MSSSLAGSQGCRSALTRLAQQGLTIQTQQAKQAQQGLSFRTQQAKESHRSQAQQAQQAQQLLNLRPQRAQQGLVNQKVPLAQVIFTRPSKQLQVRLYLLRPIT